MKQHSFISHTSEETRLIVAPRIEEYNAVRLHKALQGLSPCQFAKTA